MTGSICFIDSVLFVIEKVIPFNVIFCKTHVTLPAYIYSPIFNTSYIFLDIRNILSVY